MAKTLASLIKLERRKLDALRQALNVHLAQREECERLLARLAEELENEMKIASHNTDYARFFGDFAGRVKTRRTEIEATIRIIDRHIEETREAIAVAFGELKKFEIAEAARIAEERRIRDEREQRALDEVALTIFNKRRADTE